MGEARVAATARAAFPGWNRPSRGRKRSGNDRPGTRTEAYLAVGGEAPTPYDTDLFLGVQKRTPTWVAVASTTVRASEAPRRRRSSPRGDTGLLASDRGEVRPEQVGVLELDRRSGAAPKSEHVGRIETSADTDLDGRVRKASRANQSNASAVDRLEKALGAWSMSPRPPRRRG